MYLVSGMLLREYVPLLFSCHMGIYLRCNNRAVTEKPLDISNVYSTVRVKQDRDKEAEYFGNIGVQNCAAAADGSPTRTGRSWISIKSADGIRK